MALVLAYLRDSDALFVWEFAFTVAAASYGYNLLTTFQKRFVWIFFAWVCGKIQKGFVLQNLFAHFTCIFTSETGNVWQLLK